MVQAHRTSSNLVELHHYRGRKVCRVLHLFWVVHVHRTSSNLLEPHHYRDSKVFRVLSHEFGVVRPYRTFSIYIVRGEARCAGCLCTSSGWFKHIEPRRTFLNHIITEIARCVAFCHMSSGWFDHTEPSLSTSLKGKQGVQGVYGPVFGGSSTSNLLEPYQYSDSKVFRVLSHEFGVVRLHRTFSIYIVTGEARCAGCLCTSSG